MLPVLLATCADLPAGDEDAPALTAALADAGLDARWAVWSDPEVTWDAALVVLRSTWDYHAKRDDFLRWVDSVPRLHNAADVVRWNTDKTYLRDLAAAGVPTVPSSFAAPGDEPALPDADEIVVKPSVGAGSRGAGRFARAAGEQALAHAAELQAAGRTVVVQPFLAGVDTTGETALLYFDGAFSHAIRKGPMLRPDFVHPVDGPSLYVEENITARTPEPAELAVGEAALAAMQDRFGGRPLYARVDLLPTPDGPLVTELELTEPSAFLGHDDAAPARFAAAVAARA
ncbi:hypothetical protein SAMN05443575_2881 [Jatrophihabitans endophyticus]|uniref:ATP-grasp domain-containing protein n=1 Tax=Jatrophihabitans endophyticus TaxID=1206085 RepID=A0A1M5N0F9_9ACTN|nr:hypothetical protein [Jatrophihabitans endophyticus]SHG83028.1 hypothetical protein SAMN05443575_2881 [Jatrophihabitans endophyticus]